MIIPALLSQDKDRMQAMLDSCSKFTNFVQVDIMDGKFVPSKSITSNELISLKTSLNNELHLMVEDPFSWIEAASWLNSKRIIFHIETKIDHKKLIKEIKRNKIEAGVCLNPETDLNRLDSIVNNIDLVLFMSVNPGFYGAPFIPEVLTKIKKFKEKIPNKILAIDGGVKEDNFNLIKESGVNQICIGSAILKAKNPQEAFNNFLNLLNV